ncbi:hypothetical protein ACFSTC_02605 [Nonomuraea ferruginea]
MNRRLSLTLVAALAAAGTLTTVPAHAATGTACKIQPYGLIGARWQQLGGANGKLGCPTTGERDIHQNGVGWAEPPSDVRTGPAGLVAQAGRELRGGGLVGWRERVRRLAPDGQGVRHLPRPLHQRRRPARGAEGHRGRLPRPLHRQGADERRLPVEHQGLRHQPHRPVQLPEALVRLGDRLISAIAARAGL